ncbi:hypothetical protein AMTRI_Chr06g197630 [Amborella trichopoda]
MLQTHPVSLDFYGDERGMGRCAVRRSGFGGPQDILNGVVEFVEGLHCLFGCFLLHL